MGKQTNRKHFIVCGYWRFGERLAGGRFKKEPKGVVVSSNWGPARRKRKLKTRTFLEKEGIPAYAHEEKKKPHHDDRNMGGNKPPGGDQSPLQVGLKEIRVTPL